MDVNNLGPFNAEVWGTFSDWIMVVVTGATAFLLYKTFKSQIAVQKSQQKITDIEGERFRVEYKPVFELVFQPIVNKPFDTYVRSYVHLKMTISNRDCKNFEVIEFTTINAVSISKNHIGLTLPIDYMSAPDTYDLHFQIDTSLALFPNEGAPLIFYLQFDDIIGNRYRQEYTYGFKEEVTFASIKNPERI